MSDKDYAVNYRPSIFDIRDDHLCENVDKCEVYLIYGAAARWPVPFEHNDLDFPENLML